MMIEKHQMSINIKCKIGFWVDKQLRRVADPHL